MMRSTEASTDGWRGLPGPGWSELQLLAAIDNAATAGALGSHVLIGFDARAGSRQIALLIADLLVSRGVTCKCADGPAPTPAVGRAVHEDAGLTAGIIVTASHNPPGFAGVKLRNASGLGALWPQPFDGLSIDLSAIAGQAGERLVKAEIAQHYAATVGRELEHAARRFDGTVIIDAAHGAVGVLAGHLPSLRWARATPLPFFAGQTPDPALRPEADDIARAALRTVADPQHAVVAMVDGDGDRLVLFTVASGYISSADQSAILISAGLPVEHLVTSIVAPRMVAETTRRRNPAIEITQVPVGFKHQVSSWLDNPDRSTLGMEPNGAFAWAPDSSAYFERDSLAALTTVLTQFPSVDAIDRAVSALRQAHPHPQQILTISKPVEQVLAKIGQNLTGWRRKTLATGLTSFTGGEGGYVAVRASGTEPVTRLYVEAPPDTVRRLAGALAWQ